MYDELGRAVKKTRDDTLIEKDASGATVNRTDAMGWVGGCTDTNELNYLAIKVIRAALGVPYFETQARV